MPSLPWGKTKEDTKKTKEEVERERADDFMRILRHVDKIILDGAGKLRAKRPGLYREIRHQYNREGDARDLVKVLIKELEIHLNNTRSLERDVEQLERENNALASQMYGKNSEAIQKYQRKIAGPREYQSNITRELQGEIERLVQDVSLLEGEKRHVEEGQQALRLQHENEMQKLKDDHEKRIKDILRANELAESELEAKHNAEKMSQQRTYDAEKRKHQNNLQAKHDTEKSSLQAKHNTERSRLQADHDTEKSRIRWEYDAEAKRLGSKIAELQRDLDVEKSDLQAKISDIQNEHETEKNRLREDHESKTKSLVEEISEMQYNHELTMEQIEQNHQSTIRKMGQKHKSTIEQMEQGHESEKAQWHATKSKMQRDYKSEKDLMQKEQDFAIAQMIQEHESKQAQLIAQISQMEKEHASEQEKMRKDFETRKLQLERQTAEEEARLKAEFKVKKAQLEMAHAEEKERLRKDVDAYSAALLARDDFKPTPDNEIKTRFLDLVQDVDALARLEWKVDQKEWTSQVLRRISPNQRLLKKQILQDSIWGILHECIFCSPFRIFGEEGQSLETQWNEECGKGLSPDTLSTSS
jgi:hypothetical protein